MGSPKFVLHKDGYTFEWDGIAPVKVYLPSVNDGIVSFSGRVDTFDIPSQMMELWQEDSFNSHDPARALDWFDGVCVGWIEEERKQS